jgi:hypothetical protein
MKKKGDRPTLPHVIAVPSAVRGLTTLFGKGRGGATPLWRPINLREKLSNERLVCSV